MRETGSSAQASGQLSAGAKKALVRLALLNSMDPSTDGYAWCGPYGPGLVRKGFAVANGRDATGFKCYAPTALGKAEGLKLFRATGQPGASSVPNRAQESVLRTPALVETGAR